MTTPPSQAPLSTAPLRALLLSALILFLGFMLLAALRPSDALWSVDEGGKVIYLDSVIRSGWHPRAPLIYPARTIDPDFKYSTLYYSIQQGDRLYPWWPVGFPLLTLPFYALLGWSGLFVLPALGAALTALFSGLVVREALPQRPRLALLALWIVGLATPVAFYAVMLWEHTPASAFLMASLWLLVRIRIRGGSNKMLALAGALASLSIFFRTENAGFLIGFGLVLLAWRFRGAVAYTAGFALACIPWLAANYVLMGHPISRQLSTFVEAPTFGGLAYLGNKYFSYLLFNYPFAVSYEFSTPLLIIASLLTLAAVAGVFVRWLRWPALAAALALTGICIYVLLLPVGYTFLTGFLLVSPHLIFAAWLLAKRANWRSPLTLLLVAGSVTFGIVFLSRAWANAGGTQWGMRYLLVMYPILVIASLVGIASHWTDLGSKLRLALAGVYLLAVLTGFGFSGRGAGVVWANAAALKATTQNFPAPDGRPVVVHCNWLAMLSPELYWRGDIVYVPWGKYIEYEAYIRPLGITSYRELDVDICRWVNYTQLDEWRATMPDGIMKIQENILH